MQGYGRAATSDVLRARDSMRRILIGGCDRSGTTLLGAMLGAAPGVLCLPETRFLAPLAQRYQARQDAVPVKEAVAFVRSHPRYGLWGRDPLAGVDSELPAVLPLPELVDALACTYARVAGRSGDTAWIDHTPANAWRCSVLFRTLPDSRMVHLVRDARAVSASVLPLDWGPNTALVAGRWWVDRVRSGLASEAIWGPERVLRSRYEDLLSDPQGELERVCAFLGLDYDPAMLRGDGFRPPRYSEAQHELVGAPPDPKRAEAWRTALADRAVADVEVAAGPLLEDLGYPLVHGSRSRPPRIGRRLWLRADEAAKAHVMNRFRIRKRRRSLGA
jgi:hypothetical protein